MNQLYTYRKHTFFYTSGWKDWCSIFFYSLICVISHALLQEYVVDVSKHHYTPTLLMNMTFFYHFFFWFYSTENIEKIAFVQIQIGAIQRFLPISSILFNILRMGLWCYHSRGIHPSDFPSLGQISRSSDGISAQAVLHHPVGLLLPYSTGNLLPESPKRNATTEDNPFSLQFFIYCSGILHRFPSHCVGTVDTALHKRSDIAHIPIARDIRSRWQIHQFTLSTERYFSRLSICHHGHCCAHTVLRYSDHCVSNGRTNGRFCIAKLS